MYVGLTIAACNVAWQPLYTKAESLLLLLYSPALLPGHGDVLLESVECEALPVPASSYY